MVVFNAKTSLQKIIKDQALQKGEGTRKGGAE